MFKEFAGILALSLVINDSALMEAERSNPPAPVSTISSSFASETLALPVLRDLNPLLYSARQRSAAVNCAIESGTKSLGNELNGGPPETRLEKLRFATRSIAAGYTLGEIVEWEIDILHNEQWQRRFRQKHRDIAAAERALRWANQDLRLLPWLQTLLRQSLNERECVDVTKRLLYWHVSSIRWFLAYVESPYRYRLGDK